MRLSPIDAEHVRAQDAEMTPRVADRTAVQLVALIALALLLRVLFLNKSFWLDEGVAFVDAWAHGLPLSEWREWVRQLWQAEFNMAFYFALLRLWMQGGMSEAYLRMLSVIPAVATIPVVFALGRRLFSERVGLIAALLLAVHGAHVGYSQELRGYTLVVFLSATSTLLFVLAIEDRRKLYWLLYPIVSALAVYTHFFGGLVVAAQLASLWWAPRSTVPWKKVAISAGALALLIVPAVIFVFTNKGQQVEWIPKPSLSQLANVISELAGSPSALPIYAVMWWFGVRIFTRVRATADNSRRWHSALVVSWAILPIVLALIVSLSRPMLVPRYLLVSAPASVLLAAAGTAQLPTRRGKALIIAAVLLSLGFIAVRYARPKEDWRGASAYVASQAHAGDAVVVVPWWSEAPFAYYNLRFRNQSPNEVHAPAVTDDASLSELARTYPRLWVVVYARPQGLIDSQTRASEDAISRHFDLEQEREFKHLKVRLYSAKPKSRSFPRHLSETLLDSRQGNADATQTGIVHSRTLNRLEFVALCCRS